MVLGRALLKVCCVGAVVTETTVGVETTVGLPAVTRRVLLACGILAAVILVASDVAAGVLTRGYRFGAQSASLLSAHGARTRPPVVGLSLAAGALQIAFAIGVSSAG